MVAERGEILDIIQKITDLSGLPEVTQKVISVASDCDSGASDLENVMKFDPALVARVIKVANSAYYAQPCQITTIRSAICLLGFDTIKNVALAASIAELFKGECNVEGYSRSGLWQHMVSVAAAARMIARRLLFKDPEEAFLAGMMHDIGIILLDQYLHENFLKALELSRTTGCSLPDAERKTMDLDHALVGARLARAWNFPKTVRTAIAFHHTPDKAGEESEKLAMLIHLSDVLSKSQEAAPMGDNGKPILHRDVLKVLKLDPMDVKVIHKDLKEELLSVKEFYQLIA